jgi:hypothetical protein
MPSSKAPHAGTLRELGHSPPVDLNELFDIATSFASGE